MRLRNDFIRLFGGDRFTMNDLWRDWAGRPQWPTRDFVTEMESQLNHSPFIEAVPGPRGGAGWRVTEAAIAAHEETQKHKRAAAERRADLNERHRAQAEALHSRIAQISIIEDSQRVRIEYPNLRLPPRWIGLQFRDLKTGDAIAEWFKGRRFKGIQCAGTSATISAEWQYADKIAGIIDALDELVLDQIGRTIAYHEAQLTALAPYRADGNRRRKSIRPKRKE